MEKKQHNKEIHTEGEGSWQKGRKEQPREDDREEQPHPNSRREEPRHERRRAVPSREEQNETSRLVDDSCGQFPFTDEILATKLPPNWNNPALDKYDDSTNLDKHIDAYVSQLTLFTTDDYIYCKVFPTSLKGAAFSWFTRLPPGR